MLITCASSPGLNFTAAEESISDSGIVGSGRVLFQKAFYSPRFWEFTGVPEYYAVRIHTNLNRHLVLVIFVCHCIQDTLLTQIGRIQS